MKRFPRHVAIAAIATCAAIASTPAPMSADQSPPVTTIAGNGTAGNRDGMGSVAEFMDPVAVAIEAGGAIDVADYAGQRIRRIDASGLVTTLAGGGDPVPSGLSVAGGYVDGPALSARFSGPSGVAIGANGVVYVADALNHCIRAISNGTVSTFAGSPSRFAAVDGPLATAGFVDPRSIAAGNDGALYVADFTYGIRAIRDGVVSTLAIPDPYAKNVTSVALLEGPHPTLFGTVRPGVWRYDLESRDFAILTTSKRIPAAFAPSSVVPIDVSSVVAASDRFDALYFGSYPGFKGEKDLRSLLIAGADEKDPNFVGGFADGEPLQSKFYSPLGLARDAAGDVIVADAGNRRVRRVSASVISQANP